MSTVGNSDSRRRRHSSRDPHRGAASSPANTDWLTDAALLLTLSVVVACFGGRTPLGQMLLVGTTSVTALIWSLRQLMSAAPGWRSTGTLALWISGIAIAVVQIVPLTGAWLEKLSPDQARLLTLWGTESLGLFPVWQTLSFDPSETTSGLVTFLCYALFFLVAVQRIGTLDDAERLLKGTVCLGIAFAAFGMLQYTFSNGLFFWVYQHPSLTTTDTVLASFTNRNHVAQFLALMIGPALWWISRSMKPPANSEQSFGGPRSSPRILAVGLLAMGLAMILLAGCLTLSRAGVAAMAVALLVSLTLLSRGGHLPSRLVPVVLAIGVAVGIGIVATNYRALADRFDHFVADERTAIWAANYRLACRFPWFGTGIGTHVYSHRLEIDRVDDHHQFSHAESGYLQVASECGVSGLLLAFAMIAICLRWCFLAGRSAEPRITAIAAAIAASFLANILHAGVDFFWYTPGCMLVIALMAACVCRLSHLTRSERGVPDPVAPRPRIMWGFAACGVMALAAWMVTVKLPGAIAEPHRVAFQNFLYHSDDDETDPEGLEQLKMAELVAAARANPHDARAQLQAAAGYLRVFGLRQEVSDNQLSLDQVRDAAIASEFASAKDLQAWVDAAVGSNKKYLKAAQHYARRAVLACPLEGLGYIYLAKLEFLRDPQGRLEEPLREQALRVRPFDATVDFEIGKAAALRNDEETAMKYWSRAFRRSADYRQEIATALAGNYAAADLIERFEPDCLGLRVLLRAYEPTGKDDDVALLRMEYARASSEQGEKSTGQWSENSWVEAVRTYHAAGEPELAIRTAEAALEQHSQCLELRKLLGQLLIDQNEFAAAAKHLQWAAVRAPEDAGLQQLAAETVKQKLRYQRTADHERGSRR